MERQHEKNEIINRFYEIKDEMNLLEKSIRMINSSSRTGYKMNIEYNRLINNYQQLNQESHELLKRLFVIDPNNARLKDLGIYNADNLINTNSISVGKKKQSLKKPKKSGKPKPKKPRRRKTKSKVKRK